ncbi:YbfB/YjiJ family MFS transporter [Amycolatopsis pigmentata]|uniref:YbfB/YjiJ family MFS transporter n=1 Tax=Amycolatopsis pigmentata TaxID=450801 RepID=A0ABW5FLS9_9PSEU
MTAARPEATVREGRPLAQAAGLALGPLVALGLGRFAYGLLLPSMRADLHWSYAQAGALNTANAVGYLLGAAVAARLMRAIGSQRSFVSGLLLTAASVLACAGTASVGLLAALRLVSGLAGAVVFVAGATLAVHAGAGLPGRRATVPLGIYVAGGGAGIALSGIGIPPLLASLSQDLGWRAGWLLLGLVSFAAIVPAALATRGSHARPPEDTGGGWNRRSLLPTALAYLMFGIGYAGYMTFVVALLRTRLAPDRIAVFWIVLGAMAAGASFFWGGPLGRSRGGRGLAGMLAIVTVGATLPLIGTGFGPALGSAVLFGSAFLSTVTAVTAVVRRTCAPHEWGPAIGGLTTIFAIGQCAGPVLSGLLADQGGLLVGMVLSAVVLGLGGIIALAQSDHLRPVREGE